LKEDNVNISIRSSVSLVIAPAILWLVCNTLLAQDAIGVQAGNQLILREGTEVKLKFAEAISSKTAVADDPVMLLLDEDLKVDDTVVAKAGAKALATVTNAKKAGMMGKGGELNIRLETLRTGDAKVHLRGTKAKEGEGKVGTAVALTVLFGPIGLIKHGKDIDIKEGTPLTAYIADDIALPPAP
jgi:hypothetical protein